MMEDKETIENANKLARSLKKCDPETIENLKLLDCYNINRFNHEICNLIRDPESKEEIIIDAAFKEDLKDAVTFLNHKAFTNKDIYMFMCRFMGTVKLIYSDLLDGNEVVRYYEENKNK